LNVLLRKHYRGTDFGAWFSGLVANSPAAYAGELERLRPQPPYFILKCGLMAVGKGAA
jgi:hypothetical protein